MRRMTGFMTVLALVLALTAAQAKSRKPNATLRLSGGSVAAGVGVDWASGTLTYQGKHYPVSVKGLSVGDVGVTSIEASGKNFQAGPWGKAKMAVQCVAVGAVMLAGAGVGFVRARLFDVPVPPAGFREVTLAWLLCVLAAIVTLLSGVEYVRRALPFFRPGPHA